MVLRAGQRHCAHTVAQGKEARFLADHEFFDDDFAAGTAECFFDHDLIDGGIGLVQGVAEDHAFAGCQAVGFDHDRVIFHADVFFRW